MCIATTLIDAGARSSAFWLSGSRADAPYVLVHEFMKSSILEGYGMTRAPFIGVRKAPPGGAKLRRMSA